MEYRKLLLSFRIVQFFDNVILFTHFTSTWLDVCFVLVEADKTCPPVLPVGEMSSKTKQGNNSLKNGTWEQLP